jgi:hypothetical protein
MATYIELGTLIVALIAGFFLFSFLQDPMAILINSLLAIGILFLINAIFGLGIPINILSVGVVAIGGLSGLLLVLILHFLGPGF